MTGLVAVLGAPGRAPVDEADLDRLAADYAALRGPARCTTLSGSDWVRVAVLGAEPGAAVEREDDGWAAVAGPIHHPGSLLGAPLGDIEGSFALVRYDARRDAVEVACDPFGMQTVYVADRGELTYVSTSALLLARHLRAPADRFGVFAYLRTGMRFGGGTHWSGVRRLDPATRLGVTPAGPETGRYWRAPVDDAVRRLPFAAAVRHCNEAIVETFRARLGGRPPTWSDLTGGFDSRLMDIGLARAGIPFRANTVGTPDGDEVRIASRVAAAGGWPWERFGLPDDWPRVLPGRLPHALAWGDGLLDALQLSEVLWHHERKSRLHRGLLIGGGGELFANETWQQETLFMRAGRSTEVNWDNWLRMRVLPPVDASIFAQDRTDELRVVLRQRQEEWIEPYAGCPNTVKLDMLHAYKSTGHFGAYRSAAAAFLDGGLPFYFKPVFIAATSTHHRHREHHRLQRHMITALDPRVAAVATTSGGPALPWRPTNVHRFAPYYAQLARKVVDKLAQRAGRRTPLHSASGRERRAPAAQRAVIDHLRGDGGFGFGQLRVGPLLRRSAFDELVRRAESGDARGSSMLSRIITAELALRASDAAL